jgi:thymidylate kinase/Fe2+ or Zn2+ uptake regulation protein
MDIFKTFKKINDTNNKDTRMIKCQTKTFSIGSSSYNVHTYTLNLPNNKCEDDVYAKNPIVLEWLPRACSIVTCSDQIIGFMEGPTKFSGRTQVDEDPDDDQEESSNSTIYDHRLIETWAELGHLKIVETEKANGKFAICRIINHQGHNILICGSKNNHLVCSFDQIEQMLELYKNNQIMVSILTDIQCNLSKLSTGQVYQNFIDGWSLAGELCDGQHFTDGDNTISWFGFFKNGHSMDTDTAFTQLVTQDLKTVLFKTVFNFDSKLEDLDSVFLAARCNNNEGAVLRCQNIESGKTVLVKAKSVMYIVKRFLRQKLMKGYKEIESIQNRFINAQTYHGLGTDASIRVTKQLMDFGFWMMSKTYPVSVLGIQPVNAVKGQLTNGFNSYWKEYLADTSSSEIEIKLEDFGPFDKNLYLEQTIPYVKRNYSNPAIVVFIQGLQGSGKSTIGDYVAKQFEAKGIKTKYIEQDIYWGDTASCQGALHHEIARADGAKVILVTRCNVCPIQFRRYLDITLRLPSVITFASPEIVDPLYLAVSLSGIINRSSKGDKLMVGRFEYPIEKVIEFTVGNYNEFVKQTQVNIYQTHKLDSELLNELNTGLATDKSEKITNLKFISEFVQTNAEKLHQLRVPISEVGDRIIGIVEKTMEGLNEDLVLNPKPMYIGLAVYDQDRKILTDFAKTHVTEENFVVYNHHCTQVFIGKSGLRKDIKLVKPGQKVVALIDGLVIRNSDHATAYRIKSLESNGVPIQTPSACLHITAIIPSNEKPMVSNSFVGLTNSSVQIIPFEYHLELTGFWA